MSRGRWPLAEKEAEARQARPPAPSMLEKGTPRSTPGTARVRLTKFRPFRGRSSIGSLSTVVLRSEDAVWIRGDPLWTSTISESSPTLSSRSMRTFWSTPRRTSSRVTFLNPASSAETE